MLNHGDTATRGKARETKSIALPLAVPPCRRGECFSGLSGLGKSGVGNSLLRCVEPTPF
jgi:hypothetical protein